MKSTAIKILPLALAFPMLIQCVSFSANAEELHYYGDIDNDNIITVYDLCLMKKGILQSDALNTVQKQSADLNDDGQVDAQDVRILQDYLLTKRESFPVGSSFSETQESTHIYQDGTYTASAYGYDGTVYVTVTIENDVITSITATSEESDEWYFEQACDTVINRILAAQDTSVDAVSGATFSSQAIMSAVKKALKSAQI